MILKGIKWLWEALLGLVSSVLEKASELGEDMVGGVIDQIENAIPGTDLTSLETILAQLDYVVPITELVGFIGIYSSLWAGIWSYRLIKSWIPGLSAS